MLDDTKQVALSRDDLDMIAAALQTQEKILSVQSRAGGKAAQTRLVALQSLSRRLRSYAPRAEGKPIWSRLSRAISCTKGAEAS